MDEKSSASNFKAELESLAEIEVLESEEMWSSRIIDEYSRKQSRTVIVTQLSLQNDSAKG
jgi:hypothetical protein